MERAGVRLARALPIGNPVLRMLGGRVDLRNHRKLAVIDGAVTYAGSQNCADPEFRVKARYAPWVDVLLRFEGPLARQAQHLFAGDWAAETGEDLSALLAAPRTDAAKGEAVAQLVASGPTLRPSAMPEMFIAMMGAARHSLTVTTPYYVPDAAIQAALCAAAWRGVATTLVLPARNDNRAVAFASRSYYAGLLEAGVGVHEFEGGLLHAKTMVVDGEAALIGSANLDRRSFDLNYENNVLIWDRAAAAALGARQAEFLARSRRVTAAEVAAWPAGRRLAQNAAAILGPVL
jgi:cardiolipin synthase